VSLHTGDCLAVMAEMPPESVDAIVTDPPYGLIEPRSGGDGSGRPFAPRTEEAKARRRGGFMGKAWDGTGVAFDPDTWAAALRVAKPSSYLLAFGGTRTVHRMTCAIEDAGWIIRDMLVWAYASGFPKSKASLKPAWEPIVMARKPGPLRMLNIDECRISTDDTIAMHHGTGRGVAMQGNADESWPEPYAGSITGVPPLGRWPANLVLTDGIFDGGVEGVVGGGSQDSPATYTRSADADGGVTGWNSERMGDSAPGYGDSGTYSRFFILPKADRADREPVLLPDGHERGKRFSTHPTVKPVDLMRHLVRLVTPSGGVVLDPFAGSGSTLLAAEMEGFEWIGIEREPEYVAIAEARLNGTQRGLGLSSLESAQ
jgi:site-specific DNA-methyltransferase (adenine-specific)